MDRKTVAQMEIVVGYANRIARTLVRAETREGFLYDYDLQYSVAHSISQIAETLTQILQNNPELSERLLAVIPYRDIRRLRDKIQHHYGAIDPDVIWGIAEQGVPELKNAVITLIKEASTEGDS